MKKDLYLTLGVAPDANQGEIKKAFRREALLCHPDRNMQNPEAEERFKKANYAYSILGDRDKRRRYDLYREFRESSVRFGFPASASYEKFLEDIFLNASFPSFAQGISWDLDFLARFHPFFSFSKASVLFLGRFYQALRKEQLWDNTPFFFSRSFRKGIFRQGEKPFRLFRNRNNKTHRRPADANVVTPVSTEEQESPKQGDIEWFLPLMSLEAEKGASLNVSFPRGNGWERVLLQVPSGIRDGMRLRVRNKGEKREKGQGYGDLYLRVMVR